MANGRTMFGRWLFLLLVVFGFGSCAAPVRVEDVEGKAVSKVTIRYVGPNTVEEARLRTHIGTTGGSVYRTDRVDNDIKSLYESGLVNDVRVLAEPKRGEVEVVYEVTTRGRMAPPLCAGNTVFSDHRLAKESGLLVGHEVDGPTLGRAAKRIETFYHAHGYPGAKVSPKTQPAEDGSVDFIFIVEEGPHTAE
ncbi:MAG TPA: POTRA domain-containing protein [Haloferula sp.]